jgi:hypothetical protein
MAAESNLQFGGGVSGSNTSSLSAWGRGIATVWHLYIEDSELLQHQVNLTNLTKIQIGIGYQAFLQWRVSLALAPAFARLPLASK